MTGGGGAVMAASCCLRFWVSVESCDEREGWLEVVIYCGVIRRHLGGKRRCFRVVEGVNVSVG